MLLSDREIVEEVEKGNLIIKPFRKEMVAGASVTVHLGHRFRIFNKRNIQVIDPKNYREEERGILEGEEEVIHIGTYSDVVEIRGEKPFVLHPGEFALSGIREYIRLPENMAAQIHGKSSIARLGLLVHTASGWVDPGYAGHLTLELINVNRVPIMVYPGMKIAELQFFRLNSPPERPYNKRRDAKYFEEEGAEYSRVKNLWDSE